VWFGAFNQQEDEEERSPSISSLLSPIWRERERERGRGEVSREEDFSDLKLRPRISPAFSVKP